MRNIRAVVVAAVAGAAGIWLGGCSSKSSTAVTTTTVAPTTTTTAPPTTTTLPPPTYSRSVDEAAAALIKAWQAGDKVAAQTVAVPAAAEALFARPPATLQNRGCSQNECVYRYGPGTTILRLTATKTAPGYQISAAEYQG
jgi:hypothetical protein